MTARSLDIERRFYEQERLWGSATVSPRERRRLDDTVRRLPAVSSMLDVGAGDGRLLEALAAAGRAPGFTVAVDRSWAAVSLAPGSRLVADGSRLPLGSRTVDLVTACEVVEHLPVDAYDAMLDELQRVADRHIVLTVPNAEDLRRGFTTCRSCGCVFHRHRHLRAFDEARLRSLFSDFELVDLHSVGAPELVVPRRVVAIGRRVGLVPPAGGSPLCPQCGHAEDAPNPAARHGSQGRSGARSALRRAVERLAASGSWGRFRMAPWLLAVYRRSD